MLAQEQWALSIPSGKIYDWAQSLEAKKSNVNKVIEKSSVLVLGDINPAEEHLFLPPRSCLEVR